MTTIYAEKLTEARSIPRPPPAPGYLGKVPPCYAAKGDIALWADRERTRFLAVHPGHYSTAPTRRNRYITLNCVRYRLEWIGGVS